MELDALVVLEEAGILGTGPAMVRVEAVRSVLMFGDHDVPLCLPGSIPWEWTRRGFNSGAGRRSQTSRRRSSQAASPRVIAV